MDEVVYINMLFNGMLVDYIVQVQGGMFVIGWCWWLFVLYDLCVFELYSFYIQIVLCDDVYIDGVLLFGFLQFEVEVNVMIKWLQQ